MIGFLFSGFGVFGLPFGNRGMRLIPRILNVGSSMPRVIPRTISTLSLLFLCAGPLGAQTRSSASYEITLEATGINGKKLTSANYRIDSTVGATAAGISQDATPVYVVKGGPAAQLYDIVDLRITADPDPVDEGNATQLAAEAIADDDTKLEVASSEVGWSADTAIDAITAEGLATSESVFEDTLVVITGSYLSVESVGDLTVANVNFDDFGTYAGDGLPDGWQVLHFGFDDPDAAPEVDPDKDGLENLIEFALDGVPVDAGSGIALLPVPTAEPDGGDDFLTITFRKRESPAEVTYIVEVESDLSSESWTPVDPVSVGPPDPGGFVIATYRDTIAIGEASGPRFIRIRILAQPEVLP